MNISMLVVPVLEIQIVIPSEMIEETKEIDA